MADNSDYDIEDPNAEDDFGLNTETTASAPPKQTTLEKLAEPIPEKMIEQKQKSPEKLAEPKAEEAPQIEEKPVPTSKSAPAKIQQEEKKAEVSSDSDDLYAKPGVKVKNDTKQIEEAMAELTVEKQLRPRDVFAVLMGTDFLYLDFKTDSWQFGDVVTRDSDHNPVMLIPENTAIVRIDDKDVGCEHTNFIVLGGSHADGVMVDWHFGVSVTHEQERLKLDLGYSNAAWNLPIARMMHEACVIRNSKKEWRMLVIGGKVGMSASSCSPTTSVISLDLKFVLSPWLAEKLGQYDKVEWEGCANMQTARANFSHLVVDNLVFVFGGVSGNGKRAESHCPVLSSPVVERYDPITNKWQEMKVEGVPPLAAFAWTPKGVNTGKMLVLGGTDGNLIQESSYEIDFKAGTCTELSQMFEQSFAMSKLVYREKSNRLFVYGGYGSGGQNFELLMKDGETWEESVRNHTSLLAFKDPTNAAMELVNFSSIHFD